MGGKEGEGERREKERGRGRGKERERGGVIPPLSNTLRRHCVLV